MAATMNFCYYNKTFLPVLPEVDTEEYPYETIFNIDPDLFGITGIKKAYYALHTTVPLKYRKASTDTGDEGFITQSANSSRVIYAASVSEDSVSFPVEWDTENTETVTEDIAYPISQLKLTPIYSNYNILDEDDNSVYHAKGEYNEYLYFGRLRLNSTPLLMWNAYNSIYPYAMLMVGDNTPFGYAIMSKNQMICNTSEGNMNLVDGEYLVGTVSPDTFSDVTESMGSFINSVMGLFISMADIYATEDVLSTTDGVNTRIAIEASEPMSESEYRKEKQYLVYSSQVNLMADEVRRLSLNELKNNKGEPLLLLKPSNMYTELQSINAIKDGYYVDFYNGYSKLIARTMVKPGQTVTSAPSFIGITGDWYSSASSTEAYAFPYTPTAHITMYAHLPSIYLDRIYHLYNIDKTVYPHVWIYTESYKEGTSNKGKIHVCFLKSLTPTEITSTSSADGVLYKSTATYTVDTENAQVLHDEVSWFYYDSKNTLDQLISRLSSNSKGYAKNPADDGAESINIYSYANVNHSDTSLSGFYNYTCTNFNMSQVGAAFTQFGTLYDLNNTASS